MAAVQSDTAYPLTAYEIKQIQPISGCRAWRLHYPPAE